MCPEPTLGRQIPREDIADGWPNLSSTDLDWIDGRLNRIFQSLVAHGLSRDEAARQIKDYADELACSSSDGAVSSATGMLASAKNATVRKSNQRRSRAQLTTA